MYSRLAKSAAQMTEASRAAIESYADVLKDRAVLPVLGAGASFPCNVRLARDLAVQLWGAIDSHKLAIDPLPNDADDLRADPSADRWPDLGKVADLVFLSTKTNETALTEIGFDDNAIWPESDAIAADPAIDDHDCTYRLLARMTREGLFTEAIAFNYDCHYEGALIKEGFSERPRPFTRRRWPEQFSVIADADSNAQLVRRGDFVLNKVHGCVRNWRRRRPSDAVRASEGIILRWSQLLDWRSDFWSRDIFRDRARRHILLLIGFGGLDPVIHSSLRSIMDEVRGQSQQHGESRIHVIDRRPDTLTLRMLVLAGGGTGGETFEVGAPNPELAEVLLVLHCALIERRLKEQLKSGSLPVPLDQRQRLQRFAVSGPAMVRISMALLQRIGKLDLVDASLTSTEKGAQPYVPLTWDPELTARAFRVREELANFLGVETEPDGRETVALRRAGTDARRYIPVGLSTDELDRAANTGALGDLRPLLQVEPDTVPILVAEGEQPGTLSARGVDSGEAVSV